MKKIRPKSPKKSKNNLHNYLFGSVILLCLMAYAAWKVYDTYYTRYVHFEDFGIKIPIGNFVHGIDVSKYQGKINWQEVEKMESKGIQLRFAICKVTEGTSLVDKHWERNHDKLRETNLKLGTYHFFRPNYNAELQAKHFLSNYTYKSGDIPPALDVEVTAGKDAETIQERCLVFLEIVEQKTGVIPMIYTNVDFYEQHFTDKRFQKYPIWVAHYYEEKPRFDKNWTFWQHSDQGTVNSIEHNVDFNVFKGSYSDLEDLCNP